MIRDQLLAELPDKGWADVSGDRVVVAEGIVHFRGIVGSEAEREVLRVAAGNTRGVRSIENHTILGSM